MSGAAAYWGARLYTTQDGSALGDVAVYQVLANNCEPIRERQPRAGKHVTPRRNLCENARVRAGVGASGGMRANDCATEVERRPSAEHAGCGATAPRREPRTHAVGG